MKYIVALDIGVASVGWAVIDKETEQVVEAGSNLFPEASAAENQTRRIMRQSRRRMRRERTRLHDFENLWEKQGFVVPSITNNNIVECKVKALYESISMDELYWVLYHYLKYRGISYLEDAETEDVKGNSAYTNGLKLNAEELKTKFPCEIQKNRLNCYV